MFRFWEQNYKSPQCNHKSQVMNFNSGFEKKVVLKKPSLGDSFRWVQKIAGLDHATGFCWPDDLPGNNKFSKFIYLIEPWSMPSRIIETRIEKTKGHDGEFTEALYQSVKKRYANRNGKLARNQFVINNDNDNVLKEVRLQYWMKIQPDLETVMPANTWRQITEIREKDDNYRITLTINRRNFNEPLFWVLSGQIGPKWTQENYDWRITNAREENGIGIVNRELDFPIGQWFLIEFYLKQGDQDDGRFTLKIDGKTYANHQGRTSLKSNYASWHIFKVYASGKALDAGKHYQWIDDFEIALANQENINQ